MVNQLSALGTIEVKSNDDGIASITDVLTSGDYLLSEQITAYSEAISQLDDETAALLRTEYQALDTMSK